MMELSYLLKHHTKNKGNTYGKEKAFFSCHPQDIFLLNSIAQSIFLTHDIAIYFDSSFSLNAGIYEEELEQMSLFVFAITDKFLSENNPGKDYYLPYAKKHKIPVLLINCDEKSAECLNAVSGNLQYFDTTVFDITAIPYEQKLKNFLDSIFLNSELQKKIRDAFDAYIFLSYRKKDRRFANELMRLIHKNDFFRDIAIWYDEFLLPGENFNTSIAKAIKKSKLFAMVVTPNITEHPNNKPNYIIEHEYKLALALQKTGKTEILPIEMQKTDIDSVKNEYLEIPDIIDGSSEDELSFAIRTALDKQYIRYAIDEKSHDPEHIFCVALAYLNGLDVEIDRTRGVALMTQSANLGYIPAMKELSIIYQHGVGVDKNTIVASQWQEHLIKTMLMENAEDPYSVFQEQERLLLLLGESDDTCDYAFKFGADLIQFAGTLYGEKSKEKIRISEELVEIYANNHEEEQALKLGENLLTDIIEIFGEENESVLNIYRILAFIHYRSSNYEQCIQFYQKAVCLSKQLYSLPQYKTLVVMKELHRGYVASATGIQNFLGAKEYPDDEKKSQLIKKSYGYMKNAVLLSGDILKLMSEIYGANHKDTISTANTYIFTYKTYLDRDPYTPYYKLISSLIIKMARKIREIAPCPAHDYVWEMVQKFKA